MKKSLFIIVTGIVFSLYSNTNNIQPTNQETNNTIYSFSDNRIEAPTGYSWVKLKAIKSYVLQPKGWFFNVEQQNKTYAYFVTKEDYTKDPNQMFSTGLSLNALTNIGSRNAVDFANGMFVNLKKQGTVLESKKFDDKNLTGNIFIVQIDNTIIEYKIIANKKTNKVYIASFESPADKWEENKKIANTILDNLNFNQDF